MSPVVSQHGQNEAAKARLLLALLALSWGLNWVAMRVALEEVSVWTVRACGYAIGAACLFAVLALQGRSAAIPRGIAWVHLFVAALINMVGFGLFSAFAQLSGTTSRVIIVTYSMPIWSSLMGWVVLGERPNARALLGLVLCVSGLTILVYPVAAVESVRGLLFALGCALCWGSGMIYMKRFRIPGDLLAITAWQVLIGAVVFGAGFLIFRGLPTPTPLSTNSLLGILYNGMFGTGLAFILWFTIIERLPAVTASLGSLVTPVVGVAASMLMLSERPTAADLVGFALILAAAGCVLLPQRRPAAAQDAAQDVGAR
jgi:drug/metabolite transporter (DMT)-like permease